MKKIGVFLLLSVSIIMTGCFWNNETIEGYWMSKKGETLDFNLNGKVIKGGELFDYSIHGKDKIYIYTTEIPEEYEFSVERDVLRLTKLDDDSVGIYYRDEETQGEIKRNIKEEKVTKEVEVVKETEKNTKKENAQTPTKTKSDVFSNTTYKTYSNARFGYQIPYPDFLMPQPESDNGDGRRFLSDEYDTILVVWGSNYPMVMSENCTLDELYEYTYSYLDYTPTYKAKKDNFFVFSGNRGDTVVYQKHILNSDGSESAFVMEYPLNLEKKYDAIVTHISRNFKGR